jgi:two-component system, NtrC family, sensor kinase
MTMQSAHESTPPPASAVTSELEHQLRARDKTIDVLKRRIRQQVAATEASPFALLEQNITLNNVIALKTRELEAERQELQRALTELRATQSQLLQAQKMESIGQLAAGIAHEINTPTQYVADNMDFIDKATGSLMSLLEETLKVLAAAHDGPPDAGLIASADALLKRTRLDFLRRQIPDALSQSKEGLAHIARIVSAMKAFSHPSRGEKEAVDVHELIDTTITVARSEWKYVAELETFFDDDLPQLPCQRDLIAQAILNLVVNAAHAVSDTLTEGKREKGRIEVSARRAGAQHIDICVTDDGAGMPDAVRERMYEPFFTTKPVGKGTGQGLSIVYTTVVDTHQGEILCESAPGQGTRFTMRLPLSAPAS